MLRWLLAILATVSLLLGVATVALGVRTCCVSDRLWRGGNVDDEFHSQFTALYVFTDKGVISVRYLGFGLNQGPARRPASNPREEAIWQQARGETARMLELLRDEALTDPFWTTSKPLGFMPPHASLLRRMGFFATRYAWDYPLAWQSTIDIGCPIWLLTVMFSILPGIYLMRHLRRRYRITHSLCQNCGYDLRASTDRCPECGSLIACSATHS